MKQTDKEVIAIVKENPGDFYIQKWTDKQGREHRAVRNKEPYKKTQLKYYYLKKWKSAKLLRKILELSDIYSSYPETDTISIVYTKDI